MSQKRIIVLVTRPTSSEELRAYVAGENGNGATVRVVAPASHISRIDWLANAEDDARAEAEEAAQIVKAELDDTEARVEFEIGDSDPMQAVEDTLRTFPADELVVIDVPREDPAWLERASFREGFERFGLPVRFMSSAPDPRSST